MKHSEFDIRMKENYENRSKVFLTRRTPVIVRIDGKSFSHFCKRFEKPYDQFLNNSLAQVLKHLCENIQGVKIGERHSDELSLLLTDYETLQTDAYFDYNVQKISSVVASMATAEFCRQLMINERHFDKASPNFKELYNKKTYISVSEPWPCFDARCFNIPKEEVANYFWWRMLDAKRGSINMVAQSKFSHKQLQNKSCDEKQEMLFQEHGINWAKLPQGEKVGFICLRKPVDKPIEKGPRAGEVIQRNVWKAEPSPANITDLRALVSEFVWADVDPDVPSED